MSTSLLPCSHLLLPLQFGTHIAVVSHVPALKTMNVANVLHFLLHGCFLQFLDNFLHSFLLLLNHLLCHGVKVTLNGIMISSFTHKTYALCSGAFFTRVISSQYGH